jgi:large subunit ribosomal protein L3
MKYVLGKKIGMTQRFLENGTAVAVTAVEAGPCTVTALKIKEKDGYQAVQIGYAPKKKLSKAEKGPLKNLPSFATLKEFPVNPAKELKVGDVVTVDQFAVGDRLDVTGVSKGKGYQGVVRRHGFHGSPATHGHKDQLRMPGSIGSGGPQRVFKGTRMAGHMGNEQVTTKDLKVIEVIPEDNIILVEGAVPGANGSLITLFSLSETAGTESKKQDEPKAAEPEAPKVEEPKKEQKQ